MMRIAHWSRWARCLAALPLVLACHAWAQDKPFGNEQLDQMLAPIALYPDSLLSQVLMASTYPAQVAEAAQWSKANAKQTGDAAVKAVESRGWDPAVASLVAFPQALAMMGEKPDWVQNVGDAFLAQPEDVMNSVQRLRAQAQKAGNLKTTEQQKVIVEPAPQAPAQTVIKIEPAQPQVVYVPAYNPTVVYGPWPYPSYPPYYWPTPGYAFGSALMSGIAFGTGIAITNALWGGFDWGRNDVNINVNRYNNVNVNRQINASQTNVNWQHNAANRKGVPYRDQASRQKFDQKLAGAENREQFRGKDAGRDAQRQQAQAALQQRGADPAKGREQLRNDPQARERAQTATQSGGADRARAAAQNADRDRARQGAQSRGGGDNALRGAGNAAQARAQADRGNASRQAAERHAAGRPQAAAGGGGRATASAGGGGARPAAAGGGGVRAHR
jgi:hypothetical protein